jgi:hypothetical protein
MDEPLACTDTVTVALVEAVPVRVCVARVWIRTPRMVRSSFAVIGRMMGGALLGRPPCASFREVVSLHARLAAGVVAYGGSMKVLGLGLAALLLATTVGAQTVINPRRLEFTASADHSVVLSDGAAKVTRYEVRWYAEGASAPMQTTDLGKPLPQGGLISLDLAAVFAGIPIGTGYTAKVVAMGPTGEGVSAPSNPFDVVGPPATPANVVIKR